MMVSAPLTRRNRPREERIVLYGSQYTGKSRAVLETARWHHKRGSDAKFFIVDTDRCYDRMLDAKRYAKLDNLEIAETSDWPSTMAAAKKHKKAIERRNNGHDWFVVDRYGRMWGDVQDEYLRMVYGEDLNKFWLAAKKSGATDSGSPLDGWGDWSVINKMWRELSVGVIDSLACHVLVVCTAQKLREESKSGNSGGENRQTTEFFGRIGYKPDGQKDIPNAFHTIIFMEDTVNHGWRMTAAKDREPRDRENLQDVKVGNWFLTYLVQRAGWEQ